MNNAETLCHSSGSWKKHKYFQKIGEGANAVYKYAKDKAKAAGDALGLDEREEYLKRKKTSDRYEQDHLEHHGVLGQKWGVRRFQNKDGSLTAEGKRRVYAQGANYGGYESFRHRNRRSIDAAKYEKDIERNQKKLDRAYEKSNSKKIAKYTEVDRLLKNNRDIMVKDL